MSPAPCYLYTLTFRCYISPQPNPMARNPAAKYTKLPMCRPITAPDAFVVEVLVDPVLVADADPVAVGLVVDTVTAATSAVAEVA